MAESMNDLYTFEDAVRVVKEVEAQLREELVAFSLRGGDPLARLALEARIDEIHRLANILQIEPAVDNFIRKSEEREDGANL